MSHIHVIGQIKSKKRVNRSTYQEEEMDSHDVWKQYDKKIQPQTWDSDQFGYGTEDTSAYKIKTISAKPE